MNVLKSYSVHIENVSFKITIEKCSDVIPLYKVSIPVISNATQTLLDSLRKDLLQKIKIGFNDDIFDPIVMKKMRAEFVRSIVASIEKKVPRMPAKTKDIIVVMLMHELMGLGNIEILLQDDDLEEIVINTSKEPIFVYHRVLGWLKTNITVESERQIHNYASIIARRVGRQVTNLDPLLDAHLITGDRANATLFPISTKGNTLSIRKFARKPWTITGLLKNKTISMDVAALLWLTIQYELNIVIAGGTSSGKTSVLNSFMPFIQANQRIISIEDTRELQLPEFLHWVPLTSRKANPEGKGEITMLHLMINSLRMRPDRIIVGEIRKSDQAEVLFEAMHTGHSVYATIHAETSEQVLRRLTNPPINVPKVLVESLHLIVVQYRDRRKGIRRLFQVAEVIPYESEIKLNIIYQCRPSGEIVAQNRPKRIFDILGLYTGMSRRDIIQDIKNKMKILDYMIKNDIDTVDSVGKLISLYYSDPEGVLSAVSDGKKKVVR